MVFTFHVCMGVHVRTRVRGTESIRMPIMGVYPISIRLLYCTLLYSTLLCKWQQCHYMAIRNSCLLRRHYQEQILSLFCFFNIKPLMNSSI